MQILKSILFFLTCNPVRSTSQTLIQAYILTFLYCLRRDLDVSSLPSSFIDTVTSKILEAESTKVDFLNQLRGFSLHLFAMQFTILRLWFRKCLSDDCL